MRSRKSAENSNRPSSRAAFRGSTVGWALVLTLLAAPLAGQVTEEIYGALQFQFGTPGARALGMGGAFVGLADDATAAFANPAGLLWLTEPELAVELRSSHFVTRAAASGSLDGTPTGVGLDVFDGIRWEEYEADVTELGFLAYVQAWKDCSVAIYRQQLASYRGRILEADGFFLQSALGPRFRTAPLDASLELDIVNWGASAAFRFSDQLWAGLGLSYYTFELNGVSDRYGVLVVDDYGILRPTFDPIDFDDETRIVDRHMQSGDDGAFGGHVGLLWNSDGWSVGAFYRPGPEFDLDYRHIMMPAGIELAAAQNLDVPAIEAALTNGAVFSVPDTAGVGFSFRPNDRWVISTEAEWIEYSSLAPDANTSINGLADITHPEAGTKEGFLEAFRVEDGWELHLGAEYAIWGSVSWALRAGTWYETEHQMRFEKPPSSAFQGSLPVQFPGGTDLWHITGGVGTVLSSGRLQIDLGLDYSKRSTVVSLSAVASF